mmetsp:Transcript_13352/g.34248  ORF Transcript_13352/g.34248 Transcript_13352/m.34248 type:complete len:144 (-) Transcript_13352:243-674(-)|eukprot:CAMPEP_0179986140 /NCGR_PEP_ID=MMETSP0984-20121128/2067_1 /TAXON_ID=483367 /ORGANISM="non described non described, Strain CCMP 2436" /LENGTH=143 /DNA_ID=CAMNT_0021904893 /DNA_START=138 /DNA_END=569 /DNA_ORIENTATION=-
MTEQLKVPDCTSLLAFQAALFSNRWTAREIARLEENSATGTLLDGCRECLGFLDRIIHADTRDPGKTQQLKFQHMFCVAGKVCPDEAIKWMQCIQMASSRGGASAANTTCAPEKRRLEKCTQRAASLLVTAAMLREGGGGRSD